MKNTCYFFLVIMVMAVSCNKSTPAPQNGNSDNNSTNGVYSIKYQLFDSNYYVNYQSPQSYLASYTWDSSFAISKTISVLVDTINNWYVMRKDTFKYSPYQNIYNSVTYRHFAYGVPYVFWSTNAWVAITNDSVNIEYYGHDGVPTLFIMAIRGYRVP